MLGRQQAVRGIPYITAEHADRASFAHLSAGSSCLIKGRVAKPVDSGNGGRALAHQHLSEGREARDHTVGVNSCNGG